MIPRYRVWDKKAEETFTNSTEVYRHKPKGMLTNLYHKMNQRNIKNGYGSLSFTLNDFRSWHTRLKNFYICLMFGFNQDIQKNSSHRLIERILIKDIHLTELGRSRPSSIGG